MQRTVSVVAIVGSCAPERALAARRYAASTARALHPAAAIERAQDPLAAAKAWLAGLEGDARAVLELPGSLAVQEVIARFSAVETISLDGIVCVVDATHILGELVNDDYAVSSSARNEFTARALLAVMQIEHATTISLVNWRGIETHELSTLLALLSHLGPSARLRLQRDGVTDDDAVQLVSEVQDEAGWMRVLNDEFDPTMTDARVSAFRYEQLRPFHAGRLSTLLDDGIDAGRFGAVIRSAGFCRFASRPRCTAKWEHVGHMISFTPIAIDDGFTGGEEPIAFGQDLAFFGLDLDEAGLRAALDSAALSDEELAAGPVAWAAYDDPFPVWRFAVERGE